MLYAKRSFYFSTAGTETGEHLLRHIISNLKRLYLGS